MKSVASFVSLSAPLRLNHIIPEFKSELLFKSHYIRFKTIGCTCDLTDCFTQTVDHTL